VCVCMHEPCGKTAETTEMQFAEGDSHGPKNHCVMGCTLAPPGEYDLNDPFSAGRRYTIINNCSF